MLAEVTSPPQLQRGRAVRVVRADGLLQHFEGEQGAERAARIEVPDGTVWYYEGERSDVRVVTIVDDMLFSETDGHTELTEAFIAGLASRFELTVRRDPVHFAGMCIARERMHRFAGCLWCV